MPDNGDDRLSSEELVRRARERLEGEREASPTDEPLTPTDAPEEPVAPEEPFVDEQRDPPEPPRPYVRPVGSPPPPTVPQEPPEVLWYQKGWVRAVGAGVVALGVFLFNSGAFDSSPDEQAESAFHDVLTEAGISEASADCVVTGLRDGGYFDSLAELDESELDALSELTPGSGLAGAPPEFQHLMEGFFLYVFDPTIGCLSPAELSVLDSAGSGFSSDPLVASVVVSLEAGCSRGSMADCDMLWFMSDVDSPEEMIAETCGGRNDPIDFDLTSCVVVYDNDADFEQLVQECGDGFNVACDILYFLTDIGSEEEALAASCGGLREPVYNLPCIATFGLGSRG